MDERQLPFGPPSHRRRRDPTAPSGFGPAPGDISMAISLSRWSLYSDWRRYPQLLMGSAILTGVGLFLSHVWNLPEKGLVSVFLAAAALATWFRQLLDENRDAIWHLQVPSRTANTRTGLSVLAMFMGIFTAFGIGAAFIGEDQVQEGFRFIFASAGVEHGTILTRQFANFGGVLGHNALVMLAFFCLAFVYHSYGALLTLAWNGCAWALVLVVLVMRGAAASDVSPPLFIAVAIAAVLPHLILEAAAYVSATLASVFLSRAMFKYGIIDPRTKQVAWACVKLLLAAVVALVLAAAVESTLPAAVLSTLG